MKFEQIPKESKQENKTEYWEKIDQEFALPAEFFSHYFKKIGQEKKPEDIIQEWLQELMDWRASNGVNPIQSPEGDISDLKELLTIKAENDLLSEDATADSCYYNHLLLLSFKTSELHKNPDLQYKKEKDVDEEDALDIAVNNIKKEAFYEAAKVYLLNRNTSNYKLEKYSLDSDALVVLNKLELADIFCEKRDYDYFKTLPSFVADKMIKNEQQEDLYYPSIFSKFESFSNLAAKDIFSQGAYFVTDKFLNDFDRFPETDPLWALDKILKCFNLYTREDLVLNFIDKHIKSSSELKKAYALIIYYGVTVSDNEINNNLPGEDKEEYLDIRDKFITDITLALGDNYNNCNHANVKDLEKFYEMAENGYAPVLLERTANYDVGFDKKILIEKLKKNRQSSYILRRYDLKEGIATDSLIANIINEGDIDVLVAKIPRMIDIGEENLIKLWENGYTSVVKKNIKNFSYLSDKALQLFIDAGEAQFAILNIKSFQPSPEVLKGLIDDFGDRFADSRLDLKYFEDCGLFDYFLEKITSADSFKQLINKGFEGLSLDSKNKFASVISKTDAFDDFLVYIFKNNCFMDLDFQISGDHLDELIEENLDEKFGSFFSRLKDFQNKSEDSFYIKNIDLFIKEDKQALIYFFVELVNEDILSRSQEDLDLCLAGSTGLANKLIKAGKVNLLVDNLEKFKNLDQEIAFNLVEAKAESLLADNIEKFNNLSRDFGKILMASLQEFSKITKINEYFNPPLDKLAAKTSEIFGAFASADNYNMIKGISGDDKEIIKKLNLKKGGNDGLRELQERFVEFKKEIISEDFNPEVLLRGDENSLYLPYFQSYVRLQEASWGSSDEEGFKKIISDYINYKNSGETKELNHNFKPSPELLIAKSNAASREGHRFNEHFLNRFSVLVDSIKKAKSLYQEEFPLSKLVERVEAERLSLIKELKGKIDNMPNPRARDGISQKINLLESINLRDLKDFQNNFSVLAKDNKFSELLRQTVFLMGFAKNKQSLDFNLDNIDLARPDIDDMSWILDFIDHITNEEVMSKYFTDKKAKKMFDEIISAQAINDEMTLLQGIGGKSKDFTKIQLVPTRGLLTEFSGHIADACWASKYSSILKEFPNFTSVIIRQNPETKHERLAGAFMLIETESKNGEQLLVIRGFNPIENLINSLSIEDFYDQVTGYVKSLAKKDNRQVAIVIDDHSGGSASNRPVLFRYLSDLSNTLESVDLKSAADTKFNGYNIVRQTYLVE
ncbi:MAG: hypothetical protein PHN43_02920 [Patescibacteria group bacterium]|nr:hypothetical protein [Patescibacteria group bacterium]